MDECKDGWMDKQIEIDKQMNVRIDGLVDKQIDKQIDEYKLYKYIDI